MSLPPKPRVLVVGAGRVGRALAPELENEGWAVLLTGRHAGELDGLSTPATVLDLGRHGPGPAEGVDRVRAFAADHVVLCLGGSGGEAALVDTIPDDVERAFETSLRPHLLAAQLLLPALRDRPDSAFLFISGGTAFAPAPGRGMSSVMAAAQLRLKDVLAVEHPSGPRVLTLAITAPVAVENLASSLDAAVVAEAVGSLLREPLRGASGATLRLGAGGQLHGH